MALLVYATQHVIILLAGCYFCTEERIYQAEERRAEGEGDHPPATSPESASGSPDHLHSLLASTFGRPPGRLQRALQPLHGVPPLVE